MAKDIENGNKKWDSKILGMTKAYEKDKSLLETEKEQRIYFHQTSQPRKTAVNDTNENLESSSNKTCPGREQTCNVQTGYQKLTKYKKTGIASQRSIAIKNTT